MLLILLLKRTHKSGQSRNKIDPKPAFQVLPGYSFPISDIGIDLELIVARIETDEYLNDENYVYNWVDARPDGVKYEYRAIRARIEPCES